MGHLQYRSSWSVYYYCNTLALIIIFCLSSGYYRVNYDQHNWHLIIQQLTEDPREISVINRAQLIDDAFNLARTGLLDYSITLNLTHYLQREVEYIPWRSAAAGIKFLDSMLCRTEIYGIFQVGWRKWKICVSVD